MEIPNIFVGSLSILLGAAALLVALLNSAAIFQFPKAQFMQRKWGRNGARMFFTVLGFVLVAAGCAVIAGFAPGWLGIPLRQTP